MNEYKVTEFGRDIFCYGKSPLEAFLNLEIDYRLGRGPEDLELVPKLTYDEFMKRQGVGE